MILGIDLGTKNSLIGYYDDEVCLVENDFGNYMTPSVVHIDASGDVIVGKLAAQRLLTHPENTFEMFKREMGTDKIYAVNNKKYSPTELSSFVLESLVNDFKAVHPDIEIEGVVISVPAYFNENQRHETKKAGELIGLTVLQVLNEPSAAALYANKLANNFDQSLILDLGGGTLDMTVFECFENVYEIISIAGDTDLGGQDYTDALVELCSEKLKEERTPELEELCENIKKEFVNDNSVVKINFKEKSTTITFEEYYQKVEQINEKIFPVFSKAIRDAKIRDINDIKKIIFVGGGSKLYPFRKYIYSLLSTSDDNKIFALDTDCDLTVIKGVVLYTATLSEGGEFSDIILTDVCPFSLGVNIYDENQTFEGSKKFLPIISRNETLPVSKSCIVHPLNDVQKEAVAKIYQGESLDVNKNIFLGEIRAKCSSAKDIVEITFTYDINSILKVTVENHTIGDKKEVYLHHDSQLDEDKKQELIKELNSLKKIEGEKHRQTYYNERLLHIYEHSTNEDRAYCEHLISRYRHLIKNGTNKERKLFEREIDRYIDTPINFTVNSDELVS